MAEERYSVQLSASKRSGGSAFRSGGTLGDDTPLLSAGPQRAPRPPMSTSRKVALGTALALLCVGAVVTGILLSLEATYSCDASSSYYVINVPWPTISTITPAAVCPGYHQKFVVRGSGFVVADGDAPYVTVGNVMAVSVQGSECKERDVRRHTVKVCSVLSFSVPSIVGASTMLTPVINITNPKPWAPGLGSIPGTACTTNSTALHVYPAPTIASVVPPMGCTETYQNVTLSGQYFLWSKSEVDGTEAMPQMSFCETPLNESFDMSDCTETKVDGFEFVRACRTITAPLRMSACPADSLSTLTLRNPSPTSCSDAGGGIYVYVAEIPQVSSASRSVICPVNSNTMTLYGNGFMVINSRYPNITVNGLKAPVSRSASCIAIPVTSATVSRCTELTVVVPAVSISRPTLANVTITLPTCPQCTSSAPEGMLVMMPTPVISSLLPSAVCAGANTTVVVSGKFFFIAGLVDVAVTVGGISVSANPVNCSVTTLGPHTQTSCTALNFTVPANAAFGDLVVNVTAGCSASASGILKHVPYPTISAASVGRVCQVSDTSATITGSNFLYQGTTLPSFTIGGVSVTANSASYCSTPSTGFRLCNTSKVTVPASKLALGMASISISNSNASCAVTQSNIFEVVPLPVISNATAHWCNSLGGTLEITGSQFSPKWLSLSLRNSSGYLFYPKSFDVNETAISADFAAYELRSDVYDVVISNADGCAVVAPRNVTVTENTMEIWEVDPPVLFSGATMNVTLYTTNVDLLPLKIVLTHCNYSSVSLTIASDRLSRDSLGRVSFELGTGEVTVAGLYTFTIHSPNSCTVVSAVGDFAVATGSTLSIGSPSPQYVFTALTSTFTLSLSGASVSSSALPRVYAFATQTNQTAIALGPVVVSSTNTLSVRVLAGVLSAGTYDLVASLGSPASGEVGVLTAQLKSLDQGRPKITNVVPHTVTDLDSDVVIYGENFNTASGNCTVILDCNDKHTVSSSTVTSLSSTQIGVSLDVSTLTDGCVCALTVKSANGTTATWSSISVLPKNRVLISFRSTTQLPFATCASAVVPASVDGSNFVYVIGGDTSSDCSGNSANDTVLAGNVAWNGEVSSWKYVASLPASRAFASAEVIGQYIYVTGGYDGSSSTSTVYRAHILQSANAPVLEASLGSKSASTTLAAGVWCYKVSAVYSSNDTYNPAGESLPSPAVCIEVPSVGIDVALSWDAVDDAVSYRVYKTASTGTSSDSTVFLAGTAGLTYDDTGAGTSGTYTPLPLGAIGNWYLIGDETQTARYAHSTTNFLVSTDEYVLFVFGGRGTSANIASYESARVTITDATTTHGRETHHTTSWAYGSRKLSARSFWKAVVLDWESVENYTTSDHVVLLGPGAADDLTASGVHTESYSSTGSMDKAWVQSNTTVAAWGGCLFVTSGYMYHVGGTNGTIANSFNAKMALGQARPPIENPIGSYEEIPYGLSPAVANAGCAMISGNAFVVGGLSGTGATSVVQITAV